MEPSFFKGKRVTVFGVGTLGGGIGTITYLIAHGAKVIATDIKTKEQLAPALKKLSSLKGIEYVLGQHRSEDFTNVDMVVKTPQVPWSNKHVKIALEHHIPVETDAGLFFRLCNNPIIGITGTKGKTTTSRLVYEILRVAGKNPVSIGVGRTSVLDRLDLLKKNNPVVFELSSWRLSALAHVKKSPHIAAITNIFPDHLNYYGSMESYVKDKKNIFLFQGAKDWLILNNDDPTVHAFAAGALAQVIRCSVSRVAEGRSVFLHEAVIYLNDGIDEKKICDVADIPLRGAHNHMNMLIAVGVAHAAGVSIEQMRAALMQFKGAQHRLEFVKDVGGVAYYNDTAATVPQAAIAAIESFTEPVIVIAGGSDKNLDFNALGETIVHRAKGVVLLKGAASEKLIAAMRSHLPATEQERQFEVVDSMTKAVEYAARSAEKGDVVVLSPGATSFGLFTNEFDRGEQFKAAVAQLA